MTVRARRRHYPQVDPRAGGLMHPLVGACPHGASVALALRLVRRRRLRLLVVSEEGRAGVLLPADLRRARDLGLRARPARDVVRWGTPVVGPGAREVTVRRHLLEGAPAVLVGEGRRVVGAVEAEAADALAPRCSLRQRLERELSAESWDLLRLVGATAETMGVRAWAVGGFVRDFLLGRHAQELDVVAEGDALALARRLADKAGGTLTVHRAFGTATLLGLGLRVDIATARSEWYEAPGALPRVRPASIREDLERRDFSINALAVSLGPADALGDLLDPLRGRADLARRRLRILHPLSFVEDPTRIFRAARYQARLGFALDRASRRALGLARAMAPYPALSGQRFTGELELLLAEPEAPRGLLALGRLGGLAILDPAYRFSAAGARRVADLGRLLGWLRARAVGADPLLLGLVALLGATAPAVARRCLERLALTGEPLCRVREALREGPALARRLAAAEAAPASARASLMRGRALESLGAAWLAGSEPARRQIEWFLGEARAARPLLGGDDLLALGVRRGPAVREVLERLRDSRLDGAAVTREEEVGLVRQWLGAATAECI